MIRRFRSSLVALGALLVLIGVGVWLERRTPALPDAAVPDEIFRFEKEELVAVTIERPDVRLALRNVDGIWEIDGYPWKPNRSMIRRVAHQLHDLDARADVVDVGDGDLVRYGLGTGAIRVTLELEGGRSVAFDVGDPNPTSVSYYMRPVPGERVYVVKKSAMDYYRLDVDAFREDRIATFDADAVTRLEATVDGRTMDFEQVAHRTYVQRAPVQQPASRDKVRLMLGRLSALRAVAFVSEGQGDAPALGLEPPQHRMVVTLGPDDALTLTVGLPVPGADPPQRYLHLLPDDHVYAVKDGFLDSFRLTDDELRDRALLGLHEWSIAAMTVSRGADTVALTRTSDSWRWPDGQAVPGSTPKRVAGRAGEITAIAFYDERSLGASGLEPPWATLELTSEEGQRHRLALGDRWEVQVLAAPGGERRPGDPPPAPIERAEVRQYARVDEGPVVEIDGQIASVVEDLFREYGRKVERDAEKRLDGVPSPQ